MSSHHIVRDDQEPALIIANGESCSSELLGQLLEWSPLVVVLDSAMHRVNELGIKVDVLIGDFDHGFDPESFKDTQYPLEIVHIKEQDSTDLEKAFKYLVERGIPSANVVWATGRRMDHTITNLTSLVRYKEQLKVVVIDDHSKVYLLPKDFKKWYPSETIISLIPIGQVKGIHSTNLMYPLHNDTLELGYRTGSSNSVLQDGLVAISHQDGDLLMMECND